MAIMKYDEAWSHAAEAAVDLTGKLHRFMKVDSAGKIAICGSGEAALGILYEECVLGAPATVMFGSIGKVILGATVAAGARVQSDGNGAAITLAAGVARGIALEGGGAGQIIAMAFI